jgi:hypothetical protein
MLASALIAALSPNCPFELTLALQVRKIVVHFSIAFALIAILAGCAALEAPRHDGPRDYASLSCSELAEEAREAWRRKHVEVDRQVAKHELKAIKSAAIAKDCVLPGWI